MPYAMTRKQVRDEASFATWQGRLDAGDALPLAIGDLKILATKMLGQVVLPGDAAYDADRKLFNPLFDLHPDLIAYCEVDCDVALCLAFARSHTLAFTIRAGGHSTAGYSGCNGMMIDVSGLNDVCIDPRAMIATVGAGTSVGKLNAVLAQYGVHIPLGDCSDVRMGGYMQGGGYSFTSRMFGVNCDSATEVRVMLWDGRIVTANERRNRDLYWAIRGGTGGNFGVLLTIRYRLHKIDDVLAFAIRWPLTTVQDRDNAVVALQRLQARYTFSDDFPHFGAQTMIAMQSAYPDRRDPQPWLLVRGVHIGTREEGEAAIRPLLETNGADLQWQHTGAFADLHGKLMSDPDTIPQLMYVMTYELKRSRYVRMTVPASGWRAIIDTWCRAPNRYAMVTLELYGGAIAAPRDSSAFVHRDAAFDVCIDSFYYDKTEAAACNDWIEAMCDTLKPFWNGEINQNYPSGQEPDYRSNYWAEAFPMLLAIKRKYDPNTVFTYPQAILPRDEAAEPPLAPAGIAAALAQPIAVD